MSGTRVALLVGCSEYEDQEFPQLRAPVQDVEALERVLADPTIGNFTVETLLNEPSERVREQIEGFFANSKPDDLLLLYFSCHGDLDPRGRLYFVAANTKKKRPHALGIAARWVKEQMDESRSQRIVLLLDQKPTMSANVQGKLYLASNPRALLPLPSELELALTSEVSWKRRGAVDGLVGLLAGEHPVEQKRTARRALSSLHHDTDPGIRKAARKASRRVSWRPHRNRWLVGVGLVIVGVLLVGGVEVVGVG